MNYFEGLCGRINDFIHILASLLGVCLLIASIARAMWFFDKDNEDEKEIDDRLKKVHRFLIISFVISELIYILIPGAMP